MSTKKELTTLFKVGSLENVTAYLLQESNLPGPRMNLSLVAEFADLIRAETYLSTWLPYLTDLFETPESESGVSTILNCAAIESYGALYFLVSDTQKIEFSAKLQQALNNSNWRQREIVTEAYKRIGLVDYHELRRLFNDLISTEPSLLERRGIIATLAHPVLLKSQAQRDYAFRICDEFFKHYLSLMIDSVRVAKTADFSAYTKGLAFAPSVIVASQPEVGFLLLNKYLAVNNPHLTKIIEANLNKARLAKKYPSEVSFLKKTYNLR